MGSARGVWQRRALLALGGGAAALIGAQAARVTCGTTLQQQVLEDLAQDAAKVEFPSSVWNAALSPNALAWTVEQCRIKTLAATRPGSAIGIMLENNRRCWGFAQAASDFVNATDRSGSRGSDSATLPVANSASLGTTAGSDPLFLFTVLGTEAPAPSAGSAAPTTLAPPSSPPRGFEGAGPTTPTSSSADPPSSQTSIIAVVAVVIATVLAAAVFVARRTVAARTTAKINNEQEAGGSPGPAQLTSLEQTGEVRMSALSHSSFMSRVSSRMFSFVFVAPPASQLSPAGDPRLLRGTMQSVM